MLDHLCRSLPRAFSVAALLVIGVVIVPRVQAVTYNWDPSGNRSDAAGSGAWNTTAGNTVWDNGTTDVVWPNSTSFGDSAVFGGVDGTYTVTVASGIQSSTLSFNAAGYTLAGASVASPGTLSFPGGGGSGELDVATGKTMTVGTFITVGSGNGSYINASSALYAGTVVVNNGGTFNLSNATIGGTFTVGPGGTVNDPGGATTVRGGVFNVSGAGASVMMRGFGVSNGGVINVNQGTLNTGGAFGFYYNGGSLNLNGGTFVLGPTSVNAAAASAIHFNGGVVSSGISYSPGLPSGSSVTLTVQAGGARFNFSNFGNPLSNLFVNNALLHDPSAPAIDGGLVKDGTGTLTLSLANTYTGGTTVSGGMLVAAANGTLGSGDASVISTSVSLKIGTGVTAPFNNPLARLTLAGGGAAGTADNGYLDLTSGANVTVGSLVLGTTVYTFGTFSSANFPEYFSGAGTLTVVPEPTSLACALLVAGGLGLGVRRRGRRTTSGA